MSDNPKTDMPLTLAEQKLILRLRQLAKLAYGMVVLLHVNDLLILEKRDIRPESLRETGA